MKQSATDIDQSLVKAVSHPLRARLFSLLCEKVASPSELAAELGEPLGNVAYHVQVLNGLGCLELVKTTPVRGALEHHYRAVKRPYFNDADWARLPASVRGSVSGGIVQEIMQDARAGLRGGSFESRTDVHLSRMNLVLDDQAWEELSRLLEHVLDRADELQAESAARVAKSGGGGKIPATSKLAILHYEAAVKK